MPRIPPLETEDDPEEAIVALTAEEVQALRLRQPLLSIWRVIGAQLVVGALVAALSGWWFGSVAAWSAGYGAMAVVVPAALFAMGLNRRAFLMHAGAAVLGFFLWEAVKLALTVAALVVAPHWIEGLSWPAMLAGMLITMKVYWVALGVRRGFYPDQKT